MDIVELKKLMRSLLTIKGGRKVLYPIRKVRGEDNLVVTKLLDRNGDTFNAYGRYVKEHDSIFTFYKGGMFGESDLSVESVPKIKEWVENGTTREEIFKDSITFKELVENLKADKVTIELNGHNQNHEAYLKRAKEEIIHHYDHVTEGAKGELFKDDPDEEKQERMKEHYQRDLDRIVRFEDKLILMNDGLYCFECGSKAPYILKDLNTITIGSDYSEIKSGKPHGNPCEFHEGIPFSKGQIEITSQMILANFFHSETRDENDKKVTPPELDDAPKGMEYSNEYGLNAIRGRLNITKHKAKNNIAFGQMGNMSVGVWVNKDKTKVIIADPYWEDSYYDSFYDPELEGNFPKDIPDSPTKKYIEDNGLEHVGNISLSVWRWEATDLDYIKQFNPTCFENKYHDYHVIDVKKGKWDFVHYYDAKGESDSREWDIYAEFTLAE